MAKTKDQNNNDLTSFQIQLKLALTHIHNYQWLGKNSPLATPYFLGHFLRKQARPDLAVNCGKALSELLIKCIEDLKRDAKDEDDLAGILLDLVYVQEKPEKEIDRLLKPSRTSRWRSKKHAIQQLEQKLIWTVNPLLRAEQPLEPATLHERNDQLQDLRQMIAEKKLIGLAGPGGSGKTSLAATVSQQYRAQQTLWITLRQGLNDGVMEFLFALGFFLHTSCRPNVQDLWFQVVADQSRSTPQNMQAYLDLVRHSLTACVPPPLICIDDADLLDPNANTTHAALCDLLQHLQSIVPVLVIGQRLPVLCDHVLTLPGLSVAATSLLLREQDIPVEASSSVQLVEAIHTFTKGNPRLINLVAALLKAGEPEKSVLEAVIQSVATDSLVRRLWRRLSAEQQATLAKLSVYRRPVPFAAAHISEESATRLAALHLVNMNDLGGVSVNEAYRVAVLALIGSEAQEKLHQEAGLSRTELGEYTEAAHHFVAAGEYSMALRLWSKHQTQEMDQGQGRAAHTIFRPLSERLFPEEDKRSFLETRAKLSRLVGEYDAAERDIDAISTDEADDIAFAARKEKSDLQYLNNDPEGAINTLRGALSLISKRRLIEEHEVILRVKLSQILGERYDLDDAKREAQLAQFEVTYLFGLLADFSRKLLDARGFYEQALKMAVDIKHREGEAKCRASLGIVQAYLHDFQQAEANHNQAVEIYRQLGRVSQINYRMSEPAVIYNLAGRYAEAIAVGLKMLPIAEASGDTRFIAAIAHNLAESYMGLGQWDEAERIVEKSLRQEEARAAPDSLRIVGELHLAYGRLDLAEENIKLSITTSQKMPDDFLEAFAWRALGRVHREQKNERGNKTAFDRAIALFKQCGADAEAEATRQLKASR